jgi:hypothetical protein
MDIMIPAQKIGPFKWAPKHKMAIFLENGSTEFDISAFMKTLFLNKIA